MKPKKPEKKKEDKAEYYSNTHIFSKDKEAIAYNKGFLDMEAYYEATKLNKDEIYQLCYRSSLACCYNDSTEEIEEASEELTQAIIDAQEEKKK